jgi:DNA polymerase-1
MLKPLIHDKMMNAVSLTVPLEVEVGVGKNWLEAH